MSEIVFYRKQICLGIVFLLVILASFEVISLMVLDQKDSCFTGLLMSGIYENSASSDLKKLCNDYGKMIYYDYPNRHLAPNQHTDTVNVNEHGFRGPEITQTKDEKTFRAFLVGGSETYGMFSTSDKTTFQGYLQQKLDTLDTDYKIEIINAGVNAYDSFDSAYQIKTKLIDYDPDLLIVVSGHEVGKSAKEFDAKMPFYYPISNQLAKLKLYYKSPEFFEFTKRVILKNVHGDQGVPGEAIVSGNIEDNVKAWKNTWIEICDFGVEQNFDVIIAIPPVSGAGNKIASNWESQNLEKLSHTSIAPSYHLVKDALEDLDKKCTATIDLTNVFDNESGTIYLDLTHFADAGNALVAEQLFQSLLPVMYEKIGK
ncbi:hypothetical protein AAA799D07_00458 [Marine Group I thaumarchaeote SCGC AAA799-D07]|nr:hypothetical protein AAA799D07_00458 [Marine Group I thaumarchaeote SCGC AAA799-D07]